MNVSRDAVECFYKSIIDGIEVAYPDGEIGFVVFYVLKYPIPDQDKGAYPDHKQGNVYRYLSPFRFPIKDFLGNFETFYDRFLAELPVAWVGGKKIKQSSYHKTPIKVTTKTDLLFELGFTSKIHLLDNQKKSIASFHLGMRDFAASSLFDLNKTPLKFCLSSGNSFHGYSGRYLADELEFREHLAESLIAKDAIDTAWVGFCLKNKYSVLRFTHEHKQKIEAIERVTTENTYIIYRLLVTIQEVTRKLISQQQQIAIENSIYSNIKAYAARGL